MARVPRAVAFMFRFERTMPFGVPVVPPLNRMTAGSLPLFSISGTSSESARARNCFHS